MNGYTKVSFSKQTGYSNSLISRKIWEGVLSVQEDGLITEEAFQRVLLEKDKYVSLAEIASLYSSETFDGKKSAGREKLRDYFEQNDYFNLETVGIQEVLMSKETDIVFFFRRDLPKLEKEVEIFLQNIEMTGRKQAEALLNSADKSHSVTVRLIRQYLGTRLYDLEEYPPAVVEFIDVMLRMPDVTVLTTSDAAKYIKEASSAACRNHIVRFLKDCKAQIPVAYGDITVKGSRGLGLPAYDSETYLELIRCVFNSDYISEHDMIRKALDDHLFAETWLYIALFITCGWRASDICRGWKYPEIYKREDGFLGVRKETMYDDLLYDRLPEKIYEDICEYCLSKVEVTWQLPQKNNALDPFPLRSTLIPEMYTFFGLLILIGESHYLRSKDGYMVPKRANRYQSRTVLKEFFGPEILIPLKGENLKSRRLNKDFLQGTEQAARENGNSGLMTIMVCSFARNHTSLETIRHYLNDGEFTGETAEMVLYFMMERGVFGFEYYRTLVLAYPEIIKELPMEKQNRLIKMIEEKPLDLETKVAEIVEQVYVQDAFKKGDTGMVMETMKAMLEITQTRGKAKDTGIYCVRRARGEVCSHPEYGSCLANACPHLVFTKMGMIPLLQVIKTYMERSNESRKDRAVLEQVIIPRFRQILNTLIREGNMQKDDRMGLKKLIGEVLYE